MKKLYLTAIALAALAYAVPASAQVTPLDDPLHGFCAAGCIDNGTNTPITSNPPVNWGFTVSPGPQTGTLFLDILVPNTAPVNPANTVTVTGSTVPGGSANFSLVSTTAWTSGDLASYLNLTGSSPNNPIGAYLPSTQVFLPGATGFFVLQASVGTQTLNGPSGPFVPTFSLNRGAQGMYIVGFLDTLDPGIIATANSGALFETGSGNTINPTSAVPEPATWGMMLLGFIGLAFAFRQRRRMVGLAA
jgi:PEP-CTERM motif